MLLGTADQCAAKSSQIAKPSAAQKSTSNDGAASKEIADFMASLKQSVLDGNAESMAKLWTEDAIFIDESGEETCGRNALQQRFDTLFRARQAKTGAAPTNIEFEPEKVTFPSPTVALVVGEVSRHIGENDLPATRFSMILEKQNGQWQINQATETRIAGEAGAYEHLCDLSWLVGDWKTNTTNGAATMNVKWAPGKNFLHATCITTEKDNPVQKTDTEVIGWDERSDSIVSWYFGFHGDFSYCKWKRTGNDWTVDVAGVASDGNDVRSTDLYSQKSPNQFTWQSTGRITAGANMPDTQLLTVDRVTGQTP
jgi:uncharacterized protein (TIGR02246 family)